MNKYYHCTEICVHLKDDFHVISMIAQMTDEEVQTFRGVYENNSLVNIVI